MNYLLLIIIYCSFAFFSHELAKKKNRNTRVWAISGFLFGIFALITLALLPKQPTMPLVNKDETTDDPQPSITLSPDVWYYLDQEHATKGPISFNRLQELVFSGKLKKSAYVWHESMKDWQKLNQNVALLEKLLETSKTPTKTQA